MVLNQYGLIAHEKWQNLPNIFQNVKLAEYQIMPNHIHGIIEIAEENEHKIGNIIGAYKSLVSNECLKAFKVKNKIMGKVWQRNYYEHIIRDEDNLVEIQQYIIDNPSKWHEDKYYNMIL